MIALLVDVVIPGRATADCGAATLGPALRPEHSKWLSSLAKSLILVLLPCWGIV